MTETIEIRRRGKLKDRDYPYWSPVLHDPVGEEPQRWGARMWCPNGHLSVLWKHEIAADGMVTPPVVCPTDGCDWHVFVRLEGWKH